MTFTRPFLHAIGTWKGYGRCCVTPFQCAVDRVRPPLTMNLSFNALCRGYRDTHIDHTPYIATLLRGLYRRNIACNLHISSSNSAGHNKWSKIKRKKAVTDMGKSKMRGKLLDQIRAAVASGGADPVTNIKLGGLLAQAKSGGIPKANIESALKSTSTGSGGSVCKAVIYEGRGPSGYLVLIEALTDNRNRTRPEIRHIIEKQGGTLGEPGSSAFMFEHKGIIQISSSHKTFHEMDLLELAIEVGAEDVDIEIDTENKDQEMLVHVQLKCDPSELSDVCSAVSNKGLSVSAASTDYFPKSLVSLTQEQFEKAEKLVELLSEHSDVVSVHSNHELTSK